MEGVGTYEGHSGGWVESEFTTVMCGRAVYSNLKLPCFCVSMMFVFLEELAQSILKESS